MAGNQTKFFLPHIEENNHLKRISAHFGGLAHTIVSFPEEIRFIFVCFTNRSGSNYLAELLASGGEINPAGENLNYDTVLTHSKEHKLGSFQDYFKFLVRRTVKNNVVSLKVAPSQIVLLALSGILESIISRSKFVVIERSDKLSQAISHAIAFNTGKFTSEMVGIKHEEDVPFSLELIDGILTGITKAHLAFDLFFARNGLVPINVIYEQIVASPTETASFVIKAIGMPYLSVQPEKVRLKKQAAELNATWRQRYLSETGRLFVADVGS